MGGDHTSGVAPPWIVALVAQTTDTSLPPGATAPSVDFTVGSVLWALVLTCFAAIPISISVWALLDVARRPRWAWALSERRQVVWMALILLGIFSVIGGLLISGYYLVRVRPRIAGVEAGEL